MMTNYPKTIFIFTAAALGIFILLAFDDPKSELLLPVSIVCAAAVIATSLSQRR